MGSYVGPAAVAASVGAMAYPPLVPVAAGLGMLSTGTSVATTATKIIDGSLKEKWGVGDVSSAASIGAEIFPRLSPIATTMSTVSAGKDAYDKFAKTDAYKRIEADYSKYPVGPEMLFPG